MKLEKVQDVLTPCVFEELAYDTYIGYSARQLCIRDK